MFASRTRSDSLRAARPRQSIRCVGHAGLLVATIVAFNVDGITAQDDGMKYPQARVSDHSDNYHGTIVADPFRWLEDSHSDETKKWIVAENEVTNAYLERIEQREPIRRRLTKLWNYERFGLPERHGDRYFYEYNDGLQNQSVLYVTDALDAQPRVLLDPNRLSEEGTIDLAAWVPSKDGKRVAYTLGADGSDWRVINVLDVDTGQRLNDEVQWVKFSDLSWDAEGSGFYYSRFDEPQDDEAFTGSNYYHKLYYHKLGTTQQQDKLIYRRDDEKEWGFGGEVTEDGRYLVITVWKGTLSQNQIFVQDLESDEGEVVELLTGFDAEFLFIGNVETELMFATDNGAPLRRIVGIDVRDAAEENWREIVPESEQVIQSASLIGDHLVVSYLQNAHAQVRVFDRSGNHRRNVDFPGMGTAVGFEGSADNEETFYSFQNFTTPSTIYQFDVASGESKVFRQPQVEFDPDRFETIQVFYPSKDGTLVPMFITAKKGLSLTGSAPTILYGYGGFDISITPRFSVTNLAWVEAGGIYAVANLRGGGEFGRDWHEAGMLDNKQNVFDDFIAAAEFLIDEKYTRSDKLAISGRSNGGLLVGAAMCQRPELFAAAMPGVGVMDMLRFHKFTIGHAWVSEYGSADDPDQFANLHAFSPLHNLQPGTRYPATIVLTADHDDRVVPAHSFKFAARLQQCQADDGPPCLIRIETSGGHGAGKPVTMQIAESTDSLGFLAHVLGLTFE